MGDREAVAVMIVSCAHDFRSLFVDAHQVASHTRLTFVVVVKTKLH